MRSKDADHLAKDQLIHFEAEADTWWDVEGPARWSHRYLPVQIQFIEEGLRGTSVGNNSESESLAGLRILDVGCGGGLLCESLARMGATVCGIDLGARAIAVARDHAKHSELEIDYRCAAAEDLLKAGSLFDAVISTEVIEHVADPRLFVRQCAALVAPGGVLVISTINRTVKSYVYAILFGQYLFRLLSPRTHQWRRFVKPEEIADSMSAADLVVQTVTGVTFDPFRGFMRRSEDASVNFMIRGARKPER